MSLWAAGSFLVVASARNRVRKAVRKLREPRYLIGAAVMTLYLWSLFGRSAMRGRPAPELAVTAALGGPLRLLLELSLTTLGAATVVVAWTLGADRLSFSFNDAEVTWLLAGPVSRQGVIRYKVAVGLLRALISAFLVVLVFRRGLAGHPASLVAATWLGFAILWLHAAAASLVRTGWQRSGRSVQRRALLGAGLALVLGLLLVLGLREAGPFPSPELGTFQSFIAPLTGWLRALAHAPGVALILLPARAFVDAAAAPSAVEALPPLGLLALVAVALLAWVLVLDVPFEEAALASAERRARIQARRRRRGVPAPRRTRTLGLRSTGAPEMALAWKNWLALRRVYGARLGIVVGAVALGLLSMVWSGIHGSSRGPDLRLLGGAFAAGFAVVTVFFGPITFRTDLRSDLRRLDLLRTLPLSGAQVVRGELLAPVLLLGCTEAALLVLALGLSAGSSLPGWAFESRACWAMGLLVLLPAATLAVLVVQNAAALVFPSLLVEDEEHAPQGVEAAGTRLLNLGASLLLLLLGFLPGAMLALLVVVLGRWAGLGPLAYTAGCGAAAAVLVGESLLAVRWMGRGLERLDPTTA